MRTTIKSLLSIWLNIILGARIVTGAFLYHMLINTWGSKIVATSSDTNQLTLVSYDGNYSIMLFNLQTLEYGFLLQDSLSKISSITEIKNYNTPQTNIYMIGNETKYSILSQNLTTVIRSYTPVGNMAWYKALMAENSTSYYLQMVQSNTDIQFKKISLNGTTIYS